MKLLYLMKLLYVDMDIAHIKCKREPTVKIKQNLQNISCCLIIYSEMVLSKLRHNTKQIYTCIS